MLMLTVNGDVILCSMAVHQHPNEKRYLHHQDWLWCLYQTT